MNKETIMKAKEHYEVLMASKHEQEEAKELLKKKNISTHELKSCLAIINNEDNVLYNEDDIIKSSFHEAIDNSSECNIYVFKGAYKIKKKNKVIEVKDYTKAHYFVYFNLEFAHTGIVIYPQEFDEFEKENIILRLSDNTHFYEKFEKLQCAYYKEYLTNPDINLNKVLERVKEKL